MRIGDHDISTETETTTLMQKTIQVTKVIIHENYGENPNGPDFNDIALLELEEELDLNVYTPVCLARADFTEDGMTMSS